MNEQPGDLSKHVAKLTAHLFDNRKTVNVNRLQSNKKRSSFPTNEIHFQPRNLF